MSVSKFMMNFCKVGFMVFFLILTALCVSYANSEPSAPASQVVTYSTRQPFFLPGCKLKVEFTDKTARFQAVGHSNTTFEGTWPKEAGEVDLYASVLNASGRQQDENLKVQFEKVGETVLPVSYIYVDLRNEQNAPLTQPKVCFGIKP